MVRQIWKTLIVALALSGMLAVMITPCEASSPTVKAIDTKNFFSVALLDDGTVWAWGSNRYGQLCDADTGLYSARSTPVQIPITGVKAVAAGFNHALAVKDDGTVWAWGSNYYGGLGDGTRLHSSVPVKVPITDVVAVAAGGFHSLALKSDGTVWGWGCNVHGELGNGNESMEFSPTPVQVQITGVKAIDCGTGFSAALKNDGTVWTWGEGESAELGNGQRASSYVPVKAQVNDVKKISCGDTYVLVLKKDGTVMGWGYNWASRLGTTDNLYVLTPVKIDISGVIDIDAGSAHVIALKGDGSVWAWGEGQEGILGQSVYICNTQIEPRRVVGLEDIVMITAGYRHSLALGKDGTLWAWGRNAEGELGDGTFGGLQTDQLGKNIPVKTLIYDGKPGPAPDIVLTSRPWPSTATPPEPVQLYTDKNGPGLNLSISGTVNLTAHYLATGKDGMIYAFDGNVVSCLYGNGSLKWTTVVPERWTVTMPRDRFVRVSLDSIYGTWSRPLPVYDDDGGYMFLYALPSNKNDTICPSIIAISPEGKMIWTYGLKTHECYTDYSMVKASGGRVYVFNSYNETVLDRDGTELFRIPDVSDPAAIDEDGNLYLSPAVKKEWSFNYDPANDTYFDYREASSVIRSYGPDGTLRWSTDIGTNAVRQFFIEQIRTRYGTVPIYQDGKLYVPVSKGVIVLDRQGLKAWEKRFDEGSYGLLEFSPLDSKGNVYFTYGNHTDYISTNIYLVGDDGKTVDGPRTFPRLDSGLLAQICADDGVLYYIDRIYPSSGSPLDDLEIVVVRAYDIKEDKYLWSYGMPVDEKHSFILNSDNVEDISLRGGYDFSYDRGVSEATILPGDGFVYVGYRTFNVENPVVLGQSKCVYASGVYAIDQKGNILYGKQLDSFVNSIAANKSSFFFSSSDGRISAGALEVGAGVAIVGGAFMLSLLFFASVVSRAKGKNDTNRNRNRVYRYVCDNPGSTMYDIARNLGSNLGTVRYHLLVLTLSHRIATYKGNDKYVRYFMNSNAFTEAERAVISLMKRDPLRKLLTLIVERPGLSNVELSKEADMPASNMSRYLKELIDLGIVYKAPIIDDRQAFYVKDEYAALVRKTL